MKVWYLRLFRLLPATAWPGTSITLLGSNGSVVLLSLVWYMVLFLIN